MAHTEDRRRSRLIRRRPRVGPLISIVLALGFSILAAAVIRIERLAGLILERSPPSDSEQSLIVAAISGTFLVALVYSQHLRSTRKGCLLRTQLILFGFLIVAMAAAKAALLTYPVFLVVMPVGAIALVVTLVVDRSAGLATSLVAPVLFSVLDSFETAALAVLAVQSLAIVLAVDRPGRFIRIATAGAFSGGASAVTYLLLSYVATGTLPFAELETPLNSAWLASGIAGPLAALAAIACETPLRIALGSVTKARLVALSDLKHPLLRQIATRSPGSWQHSLAMANMAELSANAVGADGLLVRVGAYYHDLGKSLQPSYFIENLKAGETSPHDSMAPQASAAAIFAHVTGGVRLARKHGIPERVIDFMHMHHGDGLLEYFWAKCQRVGNPQGLDKSDFRYPGVPPDSRETAILAIVDAVEAASRTLKSSELSAIRQLVQRIVYGKLHLGQLDDSGLSAGDLRRIAESLVDTITHAHHGRIEYPWQQRRDEDGGSTAKHERDIRLDSLDAPRPPRHEPARRSSPEQPVATEEGVAGDEEVA